MERLPSNVEKLLIRIRKSNGGKIPVAGLSESDEAHLGELHDRGFICPADSRLVNNDLGDTVFFVGFQYGSAEITTAGIDYLDDLSKERRANLFQFGRDVLMLFLSALVSLFVSWLFNQSAIRADDKVLVPVAENRPAFVTPPPGFHSGADE